MLSKFEKGKRYRFTKEMWLEDMSGSFPEGIVGKMLKGWVSKIDGLEITFNSHCNGAVMGFLVSPEWCEEIITEPLKTRDDIKDMYKQVLYLEELEELLDTIDKYMPSGRLKSNFLKCTNSEIERVIDELGLGE